MSEALLPGPLVAHVRIECVVVHVDLAVGCHTQLVDDPVVAVDVAGGLGQQPNKVQFEPVTPLLLPPVTVQPLTWPEVTIGPAAVASKSSFTQAGTTLVTL